MQILRNLGIFSFLFTLCLVSSCASQSVFPQELLIVTVATETTDGFNRLNRSLNIHGLKSEVFGLGQPWKGGELAAGFGGGHKVNLLKDGLEKYSKNRNLVILFVDSYDVIINSKPQKILERFMAIGAKVLFAAEDFCWPDASLAKQYPNEETIGHRYLNSGGFIGFAPEVYGIISSSPIKDTEDDQLFYTKVYLDKELRDKWAIKLDHKAQIFQNLQGAVGDVELRFNDDGYAEVYNSAFHSEPVVIHGNGLSKTVLNSLGNYIAKAWSPKHGCLYCKDDLRILDEKKPESLPSILMGIFITHPTPFIDLFFKRIFLLNYPKKKISVIIYNKSAFHDKFVEQYVKENFTDYQSIEVFPSSINQEWQARNMALERCLEKKCDYYLSVDSDARLTNPNTLTSLIKQNRKVIAPLLVRPKKLWSNFWGALSVDGYYSRSHDYIDIVKNERRGVWNVPHLSECLLVNADVLRKGLEKTHESNQIDSDEKFEKHLSTYPTYKAPKGSALDPDMAFSFSLRKNGIFLYVTNLEDFGHLVNSEPYETSHIHNDLYEIFNNQIEWQEKYIHENYSQVLLDNFQLEQPCPDVYWFPVVTPLYTKHLVEEAENYGKWSDGSSYDPRLAGGYENVPTVDIHMNQIGLEQQWLFFLREYIRPVQEKVFVGYFHDPPKASMNFIVRYKPTEQSFLKPHHDTSTYTINMALNRVGIDYEGGGCRFTRYNCSVVDLRQGWALMHPGKLTHQHEGLTVTSGTRYIMVSFVDP